MIGIRKRIQKSWIPSGSTSKATKVFFRIKQTGEISSLRVANSSGIVRLDDDAVKAIYRASPLPPPPPNSQINLEIVAIFRSDSLSESKDAQNQDMVTKYPEIMPLKEDRQIDTPEQSRPGTNLLNIPNGTPKSNDEALLHNTTEPGSPIESDQAPSFHPQSSRLPAQSQQIGPEVPVQSKTSTGYLPPDQEYSNDLSNTGTDYPHYAYSASPTPYSTPFYCPGSNQSMTMYGERPPTTQDPTDSQDNYQSEIEQEPSPITPNQSDPATRLSSVTSVQPSSTDPVPLFIIGLFVLGIVVCAASLRTTKSQVTTLPGLTKQPLQDSSLALKSEENEIPVSDVFDSICSSTEEQPDIVTDLTDSVWLPQDDNTEVEDRAVLEDIEKQAIQLVIDFETLNGRKPQDVSERLVGYDIRSESDANYRAIEVKGKSKQGTVIMTANEWNQAARLADQYYLYIVENISETPTLRIVQNPASNLSPDRVRYRYGLSKAAYSSSSGRIAVAEIEG